MKPRVRPVLAAWLAGTAALFGVDSAAAYCRTTTCDQRLDRCELDGNFCVTSGLPLYWPSSCVTFSVEEAGSSRHEISADDAEQVAQRAVAAWLVADCGEGTGPAISVEPTRRVRCETPEYNQEGGNANALVFADDSWPRNTLHALALTTVWFNPESGRIYDVDIEVNGTADALTITTASAGADLQSILTHEFGHFFGLSHSEVRTAVMRPTYDSGRDDLRALTTDDAAGMCAIYPAERPISRVDCGPRHGFSAACGGEPDGGCSLSATRGLGPRSGSLAWAALGLGFCAAFARSRARQRRNLQAR